MKTCQSKNIKVGLWTAVRLRRITKTQIYMYVCDNVECISLDTMVVGNLSFWPIFNTNEISSKLKYGYEYDKFNQVYSITNYSGKYDTYIYAQAILILILLINIFFQEFKVK